MRRRGSCNDLWSVEHDRSWQITSIGIWEAAAACGGTCALGIVAFRVKGAE